MKAYVVHFYGQEWCDFVHSSTGHDAKIEFWYRWGGEGEYIDIRSKRVPALDGKELSGKNIVEAGFGEDWLDGRTDTCRCELCKRKETHT